MLDPYAQMPFGMVQLGPDNRGDVWMGGYEYSIANVSDFSHLRACPPRLLPVACCRQRKKTPAGVFFIFVRPTHGFSKFYYLCPDRSHDDS